MNIGIDSQLVLEGQGVTESFGGLIALNNIDFYLRKEEILGLIGPNGAGKTTLINVVTGTIPITKGKISFKGQPIAGLRPYQIARLGIARTFQIAKPFSSMTVLENVATGAMFGRNGQKRSTYQALKRARDILEFIGLAQKEKTLAEKLGIPDRKRLELGKALAMEPEVLLLDEVMAGLNLTEIDEVVTLIKSIRDNEGKTILVIEHVMKAIVALSDRIFVLHHGEKIADGTPEQVMQDERVIRAYLGKRWAEGGRNAEN